MNQIVKCSFYNIQKKRQCAMEVYKESEFCAFHGNGVADFIDCPLDPSHKVQQSKLKKHLKKCNKVKNEQQLKECPFFQQKINNPEPEIKKKIKLQELQVIQADIYNQLLAEIPIAFEKALLISNLDRDYILDSFSDQTVLEISDNEKDLFQVQKLTAIMKESNLINNYCYIEYGSGKGRFSHQVAESVKEMNIQACHLLIEREPRKLKFDRFHRDNPFFIRCKMDISDFNLKQLEDELKRKNYPHEIKFVGICKHMCGGASDLTITSLLSQKENPIGMCIATCCHHLCDLKTYKNPQFLAEIGLSKEVQEYFFQCASWYVSGAINPTQEQDQTKRTLGIMTKRIIDIGRVLYIQQTTGLKTQLVKYCEQNLSPENFIILMHQ